MAKEEHDDEPLKIPGPIRRNSGLFLAIGAAVILGPGITRVLETYRGVVLEVRDDQMLVAFPRLPPDWMPAIEAQPGDVVEKERGSWNPDVTEQELRDRQVLKLYERYSKTYRGTVIRINPPRPPATAHTAVVKLENGEQMYLELNTPELAGAQVGRTIEKQTNSWVPILTDDPIKDPTVGFQAPSQEAPQEAPTKAPAPADQ